MENENQDTKYDGTRLVVCFDDKTKSKAPITLENPPEDYLKKLNNEGFGIFETANSFFATEEQLKELAKKKGRKKVTKRNKEFVTKLNEVFSDLDVCKDNEDLSVEEREQKKNDLKLALNAYCPASVYIITKNGLQPRWWISESNIDEATQQKYISITNGIIEWSKQNGAKGDPVKDVTRVLRKSGYYHHKSEPYLITEEKGSEKVYTLDELKKYFWYEPDKKQREPIKQNIDPILTQIDSLDIKQVVIDVWKIKGKEAYFDKDDHLIIDEKPTATFKGRLGGNYIATTSSDYPAKGNAVTYVAETLGIDTKEAFKWLCEKYDIENKGAMVKVFQPLTEVTVSLKEVLASMPEDIAKGDLSVTLAPLLERVAKEMAPADAESFVRLNIKEKFKLTGAEIGGFIKKLRELNPFAATRSGEASQADRLVEMILKESSEFFKNEVGDAFARIKAGDHFEVLPVKSKNFRLWAVGLFYKNTKGKAMNNDAYQTVRTIIEQKSIFEGKEYNIHPRVAHEEGILWYDLADPQWRAVRVDKNGWNIENTPPILFRRYQHMRAQVAPYGLLDPREIFEFINIEDGEMKLLLLVWIISCFINGFPHAAPMLYGPQGSAKTTASEILKAIVDPSAMKTTRLSHDLKEVTQILAHSWLTIFDNVSHDKFFDSTSDLLCTVITGGGVSKRELYTDDDDIIYNLQRVVGLNGINLVASKPDLLDRSMLIELARIPEEKRKTADDVNTTFKEKLPSILGGIFDTLVKAINIKPTLTFPKGLLRMADFTMWGAAIAIALGYTQEQFLSAYTNNIKRQNENVINDSIVASLVLNLLEKSGGWEGTTTQLLEKLGENENSEQDEALKRDESFPKATNALSRALNELKTTLADTGCFVWQTGSSRKKWHISNTPESPSPTQRSLMPSSEGEEKHPTDPAIPQTLILQGESAQDISSVTRDTAQISRTEPLQNSSMWDMGDVCDVPRTITDEEKNSSETILPSTAPISAFSEVERENMEKELEKF